VTAGDFIHIPPDTLHEPLGNHDTDLCLLAVISPNWRDLRWKTADFTRSDYDGKPTVVSLREPDVHLPSDEQVECEVVELEHADQRKFAARPDADTLVYAMNGEVEVSIHRMAGRVEAGEYVHVMAGSDFALMAGGNNETRLLIVRAIDQTWKGDPDV
jgi:quercetin dioxygenase-like cupin family protein